MIPTLAHLSNYPLKESFVRWRMTINYYDHKQMVMPINFNSRSVTSGVYLHNPGVLPLTH